IERMEQVSRWQIPDIRILLDTDPAIALARKHYHQPDVVAKDAYDSRELSWHREARNGYLSEGAALGYQVLNAAQPLSYLAEQVLNLIVKKISLRRHQQADEKSDSQ